MEYKKITITLQKNLVNKFKEFCDVNGMNLSKRISILIKDDLKRNEEMKNENKIK
jgi:metal-responsive CopG/Arc/MetJ family transcriptional regulator